MREINSDHKTQLTITGTDHQSEIRLLSIDGGGVKGLIVLHCLAKLEKELGFRTPDLFNSYAGTSIGAIIVAFFAYLDWSAQEVLNYFYGHKLLEKYLPKSIWDRVFSIFQFKPKYDNTQRLEVLTDVFGEIRMEETTKRVLLTGYDLIHEETVYFTSYASARTLKVVEALIVSSSAPVYFPSVYIDDFYLKYQHEHPLGENETTTTGLWGVDGGLTCNNPSDIALLDLLKLKPKEVRVVSIGTGLSIPKINNDKPKGWIRSLIESPSNWGLVRWLTSGRLLQKIAAGSSQIAEKRCRALLDLYQSTMIPKADLIPNSKSRGASENPAQTEDTADSEQYLNRYLRIEGEISKSANSMDNTSKKNLLKLAEYGEMWAGENSELFQQLLL